jgi:hypothetical protein
MTKNSVGIVKHKDNGGKRTKNIIKKKRTKDGRTWTTTKM